MTGKAETALRQFFGCPLLAKWCRPASVDRTARSGPLRPSGSKSKLSGSLGGAASEMAQLPIALVVLSAAVAAGAIYFPGRTSVAAQVPINLETGAITKAEFEAAWDHSYNIGIEMDGTVAERLFPCTVDITQFGRDCVGPKFPGSLKISLLSDGLDVSDGIARPTSTAGGSYSRDGEKSTYVWPAAYVRLSPNKRYIMTVQSLVDGSSATSAKPMLRIEVASSAGQGDWVFRGLIFLGALASLLIGVVWALVSLVQRRRSQ